MVTLNVFSTTYCERLRTTPTRTDNSGTARKPPMPTDLRLGNERDSAPGLTAALTSAHRRSPLRRAVLIKADRSTRTSGEALNPSSTFPGSGAGHRPGDDPNTTHGARQGSARQATTGRAPSRRDDRWRQTRARHRPRTQGALRNGEPAGPTPADQA